MDYNKIVMQDGAESDTPSTPPAEEGGMGGGENTDGTMPAPGGNGSEGAGM